MVTKDCVVLLLFVLIRADQDSCRKIPVSSDQMNGECCVFITDKALRKAESNKIAILIKDGLIPNNNFLSIFQPPGVENLPTEISLKPDLSVSSANGNTPTNNPKIGLTYQNVVMQINSDKFYGECSVFIKRSLIHENRKMAAGIMEESLSPEELSDELELINKRQRDQSIEDLSTFTLRDLITISSSTISPVYTNIKSNLDKRKVFAIIIPQNKPQNSQSNTNLDQRQSSLKTDQEDVYLTHLTELPISEGYSINKSIYEIHKTPNGPYTDEFKATTSSIIEENSTLFTVRTKSIEKNYNNNLTVANSADFLFPSGKTTSTEIKSSSLGHQHDTNGSKIFIDLDNRNAVDVPKIECPQGQSRDLSGQCVTPF